MSTGTIEILITGDARSGEAVLGQFNRSVVAAEKSGGRAGAAFSKMFDGMLGPFTGAYNMLTKLVSLPNLVAGTIGGVLVKSVVDYTAAIGDAQERTGMASDMLQVLNLQAARNGGNWQALSQALGVFQKTVQGAIDNGGDLEETYTKLGVKLTDGEGKARNLSDVYEEVVAGLGKVTNETERAGMVTTIFGARASWLNIMLGQGTDGLRAFKDEAARRHIILSPEEIARVKAMDDAMGTLKLQIMAVFSKGMAGSSDTITNTLARWSDRINALAESGVLDEWISKVANGLVTITEAGAGFARWIADNSGWLKWVAGAYLAVNTLASLRHGIAATRESWLAMQAVMRATQAIGAPVAGQMGQGAKQFGGSINQVGGLGAAGLVAGSAVAGAAVGSSIWQGIMKPALDSEQQKAQQIDNKDAMKIGLMKQAFRDQYSMQNGGNMSGFNAAWDQQRARVVEQATSRPINLNGPMTVIANDPEAFAEQLNRPTGAPQL